MKIKTVHLFFIGTLMSILLTTVGFYYWYTGSLVIYWSTHKRREGISAQTKKVTIPLSYWDGDHQKTESVEILMSDSLVLNSITIVNAYFSLLHEENLIKKKIILSSAAVTSSGTELIFSFDQKPFLPEQTIIEKLRIIDGILKNIAPILRNARSIHFLVNQKEIKDPHLDFSAPWPISGFLNT